MGKMKLAAFYTQQNLETSVTTESKINAWQIGMDWNIARPHSLLASYTAADDVKGNSTIALAGSGATRPAALNLINGVLVSGDTGAELWTLRYRHQFSKRTQTFGGYARLNNDARAAYTLGGLSGASSGNKQDGWGVGLRHNF
jgi:predicted porin